MYSYSAYFTTEKLPTPEIKEIRSNSIQGYSTIVAEFGSGVEIEYAKSKVNDALDKAKINLPADLPAESSVYEVSFSDFPVMSVTLSGNYSLEKLESFAEILKDELEISVGVLVIDGVVLWDFDYIDLGKIRLPSRTVPVTIKSLVFSDDPRSGQRLDHHHEGSDEHIHAHSD